MEQKIITFFLASSITDLEYDRLAVGDFINQLNSLYASSGVFIRLVKCDSELEDHSILKGGSQSALDEIIRSSDLCFVIFWHKAGEVTFHELEVALEAYNRYEKPKIVVYFKKMDESEQSEGIKNVMEIIDHELLHYHREYDHIDSLKLGIVTQLQVHGFINMELSVRDESIVCNDQKLISVRGIPLFCDNEEYVELMEDYTNAVCRCNELQTAYAKDNGNFKLYRELGRAVKERDRLKADIDELTEHILDIGNCIASMTVSGQAISDKIRQAIKFFDAGDYDGVLSVLDPTDIEKNVAELDEIERNVLNERIAIVEEYRLRILALKAQARWKEVHETYVKAVEQVRSRPQMPKTILYEYACFLYQQTQYETCIGVCLDMKEQGKLFGIDSLLAGKLDHLCGLSYYKLGHFEQANEVLSSAMQVLESFAKQGVATLDYAEACTDLARVYYRLEKHTEAGNLYQQALSTYRGMKANSEISVKIADVNMSLADLYYQTNKHEEAERLFAEALDVCRKLSETQPSYLEYVANLSGRLAKIQLAILTHRFTDRYFVGSLRARSRMLPYGKELFSKLLQETRRLLIEQLTAFGYDDLAKKIEGADREILPSVQLDGELAETDFSYYDKQIDMKQLERWCILSLQIRRNLAKTNPEAYDGSVADACKLLADVYTYDDESEQAEAYLDECLAIQKRLASFQGGQKNGTIALTECSFASLYSLTERFEQAEQMYLSAIETYRSLSFTNEKARSINHLGRLYAEYGKNQEAIYQFTDSLVVYFTLYCKSPGAYIDRVLNTTANLFFALCPEKETELMSSLLEIEL